MTFFHAVYVIYFLQCYSWYKFSLIRFPSTHPVSAKTYDYQQTISRSEFFLNIKSPYFTSINQT